MAKLYNGDPSMGRISPSKNNAVLSGQDKLRSDLGRADGSSANMERSTQIAATTSRSAPATTGLDVTLAKRAINNLPMGRKLDLNRSVNSKDRDVTKRLFDKPVYETLLKYQRADSSYQIQAINDHLVKLKNQHDDYGYCRSRAYSQDLKNSALQFQGPKNYPVKVWWTKGFIKAVKDIEDVFIQFKINPKYPCNDDDCMELVPHASSSAGFQSFMTPDNEQRRFLKGDWKEGMFSRMCDVIDTMKEKGNANTICLMAKRTQASIKGVVNDQFTLSSYFKAKSRYVHLLHPDYVAVEAIFQKPFQELFIKACPWYSGSDPKNVILPRLNWSRLRFAHWVSLDQSAFDANQSEQLIRLAFSLIRLAFGNVDDVLWDAMVNSYIHRWVLLPRNWGLGINGSELTQEDHGTPSGSSWTQIVDSIINYIVIATYMYSHVREFSMNIMGDDNLCFYNTDNGEPLDPNKIADYIGDNFGLVLNADKTEVGTSRQDPKYLSRVFTTRGIYRSPLELVSNLLYPEHERKDDNHQPIDPFVVIMAAIIEFPLGMEKFLDTRKFETDYYLLKKPLEIGAEYANALSGSARYRLRGLKQHGCYKMVTRA